MQEGVLIKRKGASRLWYSVSAVRNRGQGGRNPPPPNRGVKYWNITGVKKGKTVHEVRRPLGEVRENLHLARW